MRHASLDNERVDFFSRKLGKSSKKTMFPNIVEIIKQVFLIVKLQTFPNVPSTYTFKIRRIGDRQ